MSQSIYFFSQCEKSLRLTAIENREHADGNIMMIENGVLKQWDTTHETSIGSHIYQLWDNYRGKTILIPDNVSKIGGATKPGEKPQFKLDVFYPAFMHNLDVSEVEMGDSVEEIGEKAFEHCHNLRSIKLSKKLRRIGLSAFLGCVSLTNVFIPESVQKIEEWSFGLCPNLVIHCAKGSFAETYAQTNKIAYVVEKSL